MSQQSLNALAPEFMNKYDRTFMGDAKYEQKLSPEDYKRWCHKMAEIKKCNEKVQNCQEEEPCPDPCVEKNSGYGLGWLGMLLLWFIIFTVLFWLIFYSLKPSWALNADNTLNTGKILLAAIISAILLVIVIWLIKSCIDASK